MNQNLNAERSGSRFELSPLFTARNQLFMLDDLNAIRDGVSSVFKNHELRCTDKGERISARMHHVSRGRLSLNRLEYGARVQIDPGRLEDFFLIQVPLSGSAQIICGRHDFTSDARHASLISPNLPVSMRWDADSPQLALRIERSEVEYHCAQHLGHSLDRPVEFQPMLDLNTSGGSYFLHLITLLVDAITADEHPLHHALALKQFESMLINALVYGQPNNLKEQIDSASKPKAPLPYFVKRTEEYMRVNAHEPLSIEQLADHAGVSVRTLFAGFRDFSGTTPMAYLRNLRLEHAHEELLNQSQDVSVTDIAFKWGFAHLGRFAQEYKKRYGQAPSTTLRFRG
ncbi:AraC family transcriptional regulator [Pseudomonas sp. KFB-139]|uniref:AraC family transcriptional regulator n=1 Tax=Pseudomonas serbiensis TaxID=3064350 RepID=A0ABT9CPA1_9PSED|nr:AraC family transcriptional regulator [Pseudomonas sp. KFB-138]MDO7925670.1 AraC family transcriptional regulator [Pseudomonas sp. KFB-138]